MVVYIILHGLILSCFFLKHLFGNNCPAFEIILNCKMFLILQAIVKKICVNWSTHPIGTMVVELFSFNQFSTTVSILFKQS